MSDELARKKLAYFISDRTGITSEGLGEALLNQFNNIIFDKRTYPFIDTVEKAKKLIEHIEEDAKKYEGRPIIFSSIVDENIRKEVHQSHGLHIDFYDTFIHILEKEFHSAAKHEVGKTHGMTDRKRYDRRIDAINFTLNHDDGLIHNTLKDADVILVGVSRSAKTPTSLYLALQYGIRAANYPLIPEDLESLSLPSILQPHINKIFGLTIDPERLHSIRSERRPQSTYASLENCAKEVKIAETMFKHHRIPYLSSTSKSIEELAASIMQKTGLRRKI